MNENNNRIYLSPPHIGEKELIHLTDAFESNWIAPVGPHVDAFEKEFGIAVGTSHAVALSSGTSALHLALILAGVTAGDEVFCSTLTFVASVNPILNQGAKPVFIDSDRYSWNMDPDLLVSALNERAKHNQLPKAVIIVHLYGQSADLDPILEVCERYEIKAIEDAAEALGSTYKGRSTGTLGWAGVYSFNGNKIITTSSGGMLVSNDSDIVDKARFLANQAKDSANHYEHSQLGYNYRMSNLLAAIGRGQLAVLNERVESRRANFEYYHKALNNLPGLAFMAEASYGRSTRWLTCLTVNSKKAKTNREEICQTMEGEGIECRPVWKPMHLQPIYRDAQIYGGEVAEELFNLGLCLPSGSSLTQDDLKRVSDVFRSCF